MDWIVQNIDWVLIASGVATFSMITMALNPRAGMLFTFEEVAEGPVAALIARSWGAMIAASGLMLIYAAYHAETRLPILLYSIVGKAGFIALVFLSPTLRRRRAALLAVGDIIIVLLLLWYLVAVTPG